MQEKKRVFQNIWAIFNMKNTGTSNPHTPRKLTPSKEFSYSNAVSIQKGSPREGSLGLQLASGLISINILSLQSEKKTQIDLRMQPQRQSSAPHTAQPDQEKKKNQGSLNKSLAKVRSKLAKTPNVALVNFQRHLKDVWLKDQTLQVNDLMRIGTKMVETMSEDSGKLINLNLYWCSRFLKSLKGLPLPPPEDNPPSSFYQIFSEPESAQMETSLISTSEQWKKHTKKLLNSSSDEHEKGKEEGMVIVEEKMRKTWQNRREEAERLRREFGKQFPGPKGREMKNE